jgi:GTP-binding protein
MGFSVAIIGRPNVGKSTLFNRLAGRRLALVDDTPGVTRDRRVHPARLYDLEFDVVDTAGFEDAAAATLVGRMRAQTEIAIAEADLVFFMLDAKAGLLPDDRTFAEVVRKSGKPVVLVANKSEARGAEGGVLDAWELGLGEPVAVSAEHGLGLPELRDAVVAALGEERAFAGDRADDAGDVALPGDDVDDPDAEPAYDETRPMRIAVIGRPNAGKSTLLNRLVGSKLAIVSDKPQTTRTRILGVRNYPDAQVVFLDTPGIHRPLHRMNVRMVDTAIETIREVDVLGLVIDAAEPPGKGERFVLDLLKDARAPVFLILNKVDLVRKPRLLPMIERYHQEARFEEIIPLSAATGENVDRLERAIIDRLPEGERLYPDDYLTDQPERFFAAEIVREKLLQFTHAEIPFASAVIIDRFEEPHGDKPVLRLYCTIVVDRESQKPIVVGRGGEMIKKIGTAAREELERFFGTKVFLDLHVRVKSEWREDDHVLSQLGIRN